MLNPGPTPEGDPDLHHPGYFRDRPGHVNTASGSGDAGLDPAKTGHLLVPGPYNPAYNPAAVILWKVLKMILDLEFVDMSEIATANLNSPVRKYLFLPYFVLVDRMDLTKRQNGLNIRTGSGQEVDRK